MFWTHIYDLGVKLAILFLSISLLANLPIFVDSGILLVIVALVISALLYIFFLRTLGSYLYSRFILKMPVRFSQAKQLNDALAPNPFYLHDMKWLPLNEVKGLDPNNKYAAALELLDNWKEQKKANRKQQVEKFQASSTKSKFFEVTVIVLVILCFVVSFLDLPPASLVAKYYCSLLDTNSYPPILIGLILTLLLLIPIVIIKKMIQHK